jgi:hypothetical protein
METLNLVHEENREFIEGKAQQLAEAEEVFQNINWQKDFPPLMTPNEKRTSIISLFVLGFIFAGSGLYVLSNSGSSLIRLIGSDEMNIFTAIQRLFLPVCSSVPIIYVGIICLLTARKGARYHIDQTKDYYTKLIDAGILIEGILQTIRPAYENRKVDKLYTLGKKELIFEFQSPNGRSLTNSYFMFKPPEFPAGSRVYVLFYDETLSIIL